MASRIAGLKAHHRAIDRRLRNEVNRPLPDQMLVSELKKRKLRIKEQMSSSA